MNDRAILVEFEGSAFMQHRRSGISRYFGELLAAFDAEPGLGVEPVTPYRYISSVHGVTGHGRTLRSVALPRALRRPVLTAANKRFVRSAPASDLVHLPLYDRDLIDVVRRRPAVTTVYDFTAEQFPELVDGAAEQLDLKRQFLHAADALLTISETTARDLKRIMPEIDKPVVVAPLAVSASFAQPRRKRLRGVPDRYLLFVGNRARHKNIELLYRAFLELSPRHPDLRIVLSGAGLPDEDERLQDLGIIDRVHRIKVSDAALPHLYRNASALVMPSRYEGFGLPVLEAMAAGCPVVISSAPALVEVVDGAGDVVEHDDVESLVAVLERLLQDRELARRRIEVGRSRAADFTWERTARLTSRAYVEALEVTEKKGSLQ